MKQNTSDKKPNDAAESKSSSNNSSSRRKPRRRKNNQRTTANAGRDQTTNKEAAREPSSRPPTSNNGSKESNNKGNNNKKNHAKKKSTKQASPPRYPPHWTLSDCHQAYAESELIRGTIRVLNGGSTSFVACDKGSLQRDVCLMDEIARNRALHGDTVYVQLLEDECQPSSGSKDNDDTKVAVISRQQQQQQQEHSDDHDKDTTTQTAAPTLYWQDDSVQMDLWNPQVPIPKPKPSSVDQEPMEPQHKGVVVAVLPPQNNRIVGGRNNNTVVHKRIVGRLSQSRQSGMCLLTPNQSSLPQFVLTQPPKKAILNNNNNNQLYTALYEYGSWQASHKWPPASNLEPLAQSGSIEDEIKILLTEFGVDHGDFSSDILNCVQSAVQDGLFYDDQNDLNWKPTPDMYVGRRDYRNQRIFTIDPSTAKDLDDALHISELKDGSIEVGVHIADVSYFCCQDSLVDGEARKRATTVYLVDRTVPMLPRALCEIACSLNENVERLAFSCVWRMNRDGTLRQKRTNDGQKTEDVWYGRTVIRSCARLDYSTAQNIIENKVATGEDESQVDETYWELSRRPTGGHTIDEVAADVRLMHIVAMARRKLRFENGALALNNVKLTFELDTDGQTPLLAAPYPIRDSNRLVEEYMLLANYLVAQRLITHAHDRACLRFHPPPLLSSMKKVAAVAKAGMNFTIDTTSSRTMQESLLRFSQTCEDPVALQCVTQMLTLPMQQAKYFAAGSMAPENWRHFALNMPYYTHFTSPIRRYPDVIVHRLLQATIDGDEAVTTFPWDSNEIQAVCEHCSDMQIASKEAQSRCDRVYLSLFVRKHPIPSELGIVTSVGRKAFTCFIPSLGADAMLFLEEHDKILTWSDKETEKEGRTIIMEQKKDGQEPRWNSLTINVFVKLCVTVVCKEKLPIDIKLRFEGPWTE